MDGPARLMWTTLRHWRQETGVLIHPWEKRALMRLDRILLDPESEPEEDA
jgi:hypothetical protein